MPLLAKLKHAVELAEQIEALQAELAALLRGSHAQTPAASSGATRTRNRARTSRPPAETGAKAAVGASGVPEPRVSRVSLEGRAKIAEAQRRRWAKWRQA